VVRREGPLQLLVQGLVRLDEASRGILYLLDGQGVERVDEGYAQAVAIDGERHGEQFGRQLAAHLGQRVGHDVDARQVDERDADRLLDGARDALLGDDAEVGEDVGQAATDFGVTGYGLLQRVVRDVAAFEQYRSQPLVADR